MISLMYDMVNCAGGRRCNPHLEELEKALLLGVSVSSPDKRPARSMGIYRTNQRQGFYSYTPLNNRSEKGPGQDGISLQLPGCHAAWEAGAPHPRPAALDGCRGDKWRRRLPKCWKHVEAVDE